MARTVLRRARREQRLTQRELAERSGISQNVIARYESRQQQPSVAALERLVAACGLELGWTLTKRSGPGPDLRFPGPLGRRLTAQRERILQVLSEAGVSDPTIYGGVADGSEPVGCTVYIAVTPPAGRDRIGLMVASGHISLMLGAPVRVLPREEMLDYGYDASDGVPLIPPSDPQP
ncbi:transcriptional regulator with XRE-family HTH domain [Knoellia remsis]|uniref:Transcriptional regulator with XRE-family HTH domain n=2 Tax=Knoellia remsis TaxID=407159 RepID=A0A2T0UGQ7_9MICO|nr:transcriptional regulator with XRE-family HTH domain [Knoellia remsis]